MENVEKIEGVNGRGNKQDPKKNLNVIHFLNKVKSQFQEMATKTQKEIPVAGYYRSWDYQNPAGFFSHRSGTFLKNKRVQAKINLRRKLRV